MSKDIYIEISKAICQMAEEQPVETLSPREKTALKLFEKKLLEQLYEESR